MVHVQYQPLCNLDVRHRTEMIIVFLASAPLVSGLMILLCIVSTSFVVLAITAVSLG